MVKFCGLTTNEDIAAVNRLKPEWIGMVLFYPKSRRNVTPDRAAELLSALDPGIRKVAVMVSPDTGQLEICRNTGFQYVQIHGTVTEELLDASPLPVILAMNGIEEEKGRLAYSHPAVVGLLYDAAEPGSGKAFDWSSIPERTGTPGTDKLVFLSGGLNPENVARAISTVHPDVVDVSSGIEWDDPEKKGKDPDKMWAFLRAVPERNEK